MADIPDLTYPTTTSPLCARSLGEHTLRTDVFTLFMAWSVTEIVRYGYFALKVLGVSPYPLVWFRYSTFIFLYPLGVAR